MLPPPAPYPPSSMSSTSTSRRDLWILQGCSGTVECFWPTPSFSQNSNIETSQSSRSLQAPVLRYNSPSYLVSLSRVDDDPFGKMKLDEISAVFRADISLETCDFKSGSLCCSGSRFSVPRTECTVIPDVGATSVSALRCSRQRVIVNNDFRVATRARHITSFGFRVRDFRVTTGQLLALAVPGST